MSPETDQSDQHPSSLAALLDASSEGIFGMDLAGRCTFINRAAQTFLGYPPEEILHQDVHALIHSTKADGSPYPPEECPMLRVLSNGRRIRLVRERFWHKSGAPLPGLYSCSPIRREETVVGAVVTLVDLREYERALEERQALQEQAEGAEARYRALFANAADGILVADDRGRYLDANPAAADLLRYTREELLRMSVIDVVANDAGWTEEEWQTYLRQGSWRAEVELRRKDGSRVPVEARATVVPLPSGQVYLSVLRDTTDRRKAEEALRDEAHLVETMHRMGAAFAAELDLQRLVQALTDATTDLTGAQFGALYYNVSGRPGEPFSLYACSGTVPQSFDAEIRPGGALGVAATLVGEGAVRLTDLTRDDRFRECPPFLALPEGPSPVRSYLAVPVIRRSGEKVGGLIFGHSSAGVFGQRAERLVVGIAAEAAVAIENARLYEALQSAVNIRDQFLAIAAHELRTPITSIQASAQFTLRQWARGRSLDPEQVQARLQTISSQAERLGRLINHLLDVSHIEAGKLILNLERTDLGALAARVIESMQAITERHRLTLTLTESVLVSADPLRLEQVVTNLIANAIKYMPDGGTVQVHVTATGASARLAVRDNGLGIGTAEQERIFDRYFQAHAGSHLSGLGLGLYISRQIVEQHDGTIEVASTEGLGSTFTVTLPLAEDSR